MDSKIEDAAPPSDERKCYNCGQPGHISRECPSPRVERTSRPRGEPRGEYTDRRPPRRCFNCGRIGHLSADCKLPAGNKSCYNCGKSGHISKDCTEPRQQQQQK